MSSKRRSRKPSAYAQAGVDIDEMMKSLAAVKRLVKSTRTNGVLSEIGSFGGLFASPGADAVLVASTDGVGTKLKVACMAGRHDTVGQDLVNHCTNDILVQGAMPLFFLDYIGTSQLKGPIFKEVVSGFCKACRENNCALLGGETAEMPGLYPPGEYDLVGAIVGAVPRSEIITGETIRPGDVLIGLKSSGLHTNGYSLARKVIFDECRLNIADTFPGTRKTVADMLLAVHKSYLAPVRSLLASVKIHGMAHITGGGLPDNLERILPRGMQARVDRSLWSVPNLFQFIRDRGNVDRDEMYRVFNMGIGLVVVVRRKDVKQAMTALSGGKAVGIGSIVSGKRSVVLEN